MLKRERKKTDRTSRQTQAGIGDSAHAHRGGHVQNRIRRRQVRRGKIEHISSAEQPRTDGGSGRQGKACQHRRGRGLAGAHRSRHPKKERCNKIQTPQLHVPRGHAAQGSCRVEQERDNTSRGSNNGNTTDRKRRQQHRLWSDPEHTRKRSSRRRASATELSRPGIHRHSNSRCSMWRHLCSLAA